MSFFRVLSGIYLHCKNVDCFYLNIIRLLSEWYRQLGGMQREDGSSQAR